VHSEIIPYAQSVSKLSEVQAVGCEGGCGEWFHRKCSGIRVGEFNVLKFPPMVFVTLHTSSKSFKQHKKERALATLSAMHDIENLRLLSLQKPSNRFLRK
jgi:hypothetical protein